MKNYHFWKIEKRLREKREKELSNALEPSQHAAKHAVMDTYCFRKEVRAYAYYSDIPCVRYYHHIEIDEEKQQPPLGKVTVVNK